MSTTSKNRADLGEALQEMRDRLDEAKGSDLQDATAVSLATSTPEGHPSIRTIYICDILESGPAFFVNMDSGKGKQIAANPQVALCMFWPQLQQQVTLEGKVEVLPAETADDLWRHRSRDSQLASWVSDQNPTEETRASLTVRRDQLKADFDFASVPRPENWQALLIHPSRIEFWKTGWHRMRQRKLYSKNAHGDWEVEIENP